MITTRLILQLLITLLILHACTTLAKHGSHKHDHDHDHGYHHGKHDHSEHEDEDGDKHDYGNHGDDRKHNHYHKNDSDTKHNEKRIDNVKLSTGASIPLVGLGTWQLEGSKLEQVLDEALEIGYRHIDTATVYKNEEVIGKVLHKWLSSGKLKREDVFVTTKLPRYGNKPELVKKYLQESLEKLQLDYVDLYLIQLPMYIPEEGSEFNSDGTIKIVDTDILAIWEELETQVSAGKVKAIGVSNFNQPQLIRIKKHCKILPAVLQTELHVYLQEKPLVDFCKNVGIQVVAFSPLGTRGSFQTIFKEKTFPNLLEDDVVKRIANSYKKTPAQILLRFFTQQGIVTIPKSSSKEHLEQNLKIFDFFLTKSEMHSLKQLDKGENGRIGRLYEIFKGIEKHPEYPHPYY